MRVLTGERKRSPDVVLAKLADVVARERHTALLRIEEAEQEVRDRRLAGAARPDERDPPARLEPQIEAAQRRRLSRRVAGSNTLEGHDRGKRGRRARLGGIAHGRLAVDELEHAAAGCDRGPELRGGGPKRRDALERRQREQSGRRDEHPVNRRVGRHSKHTGDGQAGDQDRQALREAGCERVAPAEAGELAAPCPDAGEGVLLAPVDDELRRTSQQLDELGGELRPRGALTTAGGPGQGDRQRRNEHADEDQPNRKNRGSGGQERRRHSHARRPDRECHERRREPSDVQPLERVDVADHSAEELASPVALELAGSERLDPLVEARADPAQSPECDVMRGDALEVTGERPRETEEPDRDDRHGQREDRRLLRGTGDQIAGRRHQSDPEPDREHAEHGEHGNAPRGHACEADEPTERRGHAAAATVSTTLPSCKRTTRSARAASSGR